MENKKLVIGITERGDAGIDLSWFGKVENGNYNGAILITKNISPIFSEKILSMKKPAILHCTCTGWGHSWLEPCSPVFTNQIDALNSLIKAGFPAERCVLRIDPILPTEEGIDKVRMVLDYAASKLPMENIRIRISVLDEYKHVRERFINSGHRPVYGGSFYAPWEMKRNVIKMLTEEYPYFYETCAEDWMHEWKPERFSSRQGCLSTKDLDILGFSYPEEISQNMQQRTGCHCLEYKRELLAGRNICPNGCLYCYWKDK